MAKSKPGAGSNDGTKQSAKPPKHEDCNIEHVAGYHHRDITDNRLVWEVLEEGDNNGKY